MGGSTGEGSLLDRERGRGQSELIGVVLLLGITLTGSIAVVAFGSTAIEDARGVAGTEGVGHAMTQFDSRAAIVALGDADTQSITLGSGSSGSFHVEPNAGWMNISHVNHSGSGDAEELLNVSLGALVYDDDEAVIAYQGGGVWRKQGNGSVMISPPEFHYRDATLTLPVISVDGSASASGNVRAQVTKKTSAHRIFPNESANYDDGGSAYQNPVRNGNVTVTVHSGYYKAWASYFRDRTSGAVEVFHVNDTVRATLLSQGTAGDFNMPPNGNSINIQGMGAGHPFSNFTITVYPDDTDSAQFNNLKWSLYADRGSKEFEMSLQRSGNANDDGEDCNKLWVSATVYYSDQNGEPYHGWHKEQAFKTECYDGNGNGDDDQTRLVANLTGDVQLSMQDLSTNDVINFEPKNNDRQHSVWFDQHEGSVDWEEHKFNDSTTGSNYDDDTTIGNLTNHYLSLIGPDVKLIVKDKGGGGGTVSEEASFGIVEYDSTGSSFITFLHITENRIEVEFQ